MVPLSLSAAGAEARGDVARHTVPSKRDDGTAPVGRSRHVMEAQGIEPWSE